MRRIVADDRAISPVVGTVLLVGIVAIMVGVSGVLFFGLVDTTDPAPTVVLNSEPGENDLTYRLIHERGDAIDGDSVELRGAADPEATADDRLTAGYEVTVYPTADEIKIVWFSESGESYVLTTVEVSQTVPEPDEGCDWVDDRTNGGNNTVKIDGLVVNCDVETSKVVEVQNGSVVVGMVVSDSKELDADDAEIYGDVNVEKVLNVQNGTITGDAASQTADVKIHDGSRVTGSIDAQEVAEVASDSEVEGNVRSRTGEAKIQRSSVEGSVTGNDSVDLDDATIGGHVYIDSSDFDCTDSTINGESCGSYTPKDPNNWPGE